jgi:hypothetical protein
MVVLHSFINHLDTTKIVDLEKGTKEAMCGGDGTQHCKGTNYQTQKIVEQKLMKENIQVLEESQKNCEGVGLVSIRYQVNQSYPNVMFKYVP